MDIQARDSELFEMKELIFKLGVDWMNAVKAFGRLRNFP